MLLVNVDATTVILIVMTIKKMKYKINKSAKLGNKVALINVGQCIS